LSKAWYTAQILPIPVTMVRQINTTISWHIWKREIFKVPLTSLTREKEQRGLDPPKHRSKV
jgi:hypothetical protein